MVLILLWWLPFWALSPYIANSLDVSSASVTIVIVAAQTVFGIIGIYIAGKQAADIIRGSSLKKAPKTMWRILWTGKTDK